MKKYFTLKEATAFCVDNNIRTNVEYRSRYKEADGMLPSLPSNIYEEWDGWPNFLNTKKKYPAFSDLRLMVVDKVRTSGEYHIYAKAKDLPLSPHLIYSEWESWPKFLNTKKRFLNYDEAIDVVYSSLDIVGVKSYQSNYKNYKGLPSMPQDVYTDDWVDWYTFLSKDRRSNQFTTYEEAKELTGMHNIKTSSEYKNKYKILSSKLPSDPSIAYKRSGWNDWSSFLR